MRGFRSIISHVILNVNCRIPVGRPVSPARIPRPSMYASVVTARQRMRRSHCHTSGIAGITHGCPGSGRHGHTAQFSWCARRDSNPHDVTHCHLKAARLPIPPRALGRSARDLSPTRSRPDQRRRCNKSGMEGQGPPARWFRRKPDQDRPSGCPASAAAFA
jgi:hypothetical protein